MDLKQAVGLGIGGALALALEPNLAGLAHLSIVAATWALAWRTYGRPAWLVALAAGGARTGLDPLLLLVLGAGLGLAALLPRHQVPAACLGAAPAAAMIEPVGAVIAVGALAAWTPAPRAFTFGGLEQAARLVLYGTAGALLVAGLGAAMLPDDARAGMFAAAVLLLGGIQGIALIVLHRAGAPIGPAIAGLVALASLAVALVAGRSVAGVPVALVQVAALGVLRFAWVPALFLGLFVGQLALLPRP